MANPAFALDSSLVFALPSNASQALYPENTVTDFRVAVTERVALCSNDYEVALAGFTYACTRYNMQDLAGQRHMVTFAFLPGYLHPPPRSSDRLLTALQKCHHLMIVRAPHSSRARGPLVLDTTSTSGISFTTWMWMAVAAGWCSN